MVGLSVQDYTQSPGMQVASGCLLTDSAGNVLLVKPTCKPPREVPGVVVEQGGHGPDLPVASGGR